MVVTRSKHSSNINTEGFYQKMLECQLGGAHKTYIFGVSDIETDGCDPLLIEIKKWYDWKEVVGQLLAYNYMSRKRKKMCAFFFGKRYPTKKENLIIKFLKRYSIHVYNMTYNVMNDRINYESLVV